jgi:NTE family protein
MEALVDETGGDPSVLAPTELAAAPVKDGTGRDPGPTLCLSGGGFRATLFHLGALIRLNELGVLSGMKVISSVSGGSILNGVLATHWDELKADQEGFFTNFEIISDKVLSFCARDLRTGVLLRGRFNPRFALPLIRDLAAVPADALVKPYSNLIGTKRLDQLPDPRTGKTRFIFCATNVLTGACWHFHGGPAGRMGDFYTGYFDVGQVTLSQAVAASSAFPPGFGGLGLCPPEQPDRVDPWGRNRPPSPKPGKALRTSGRSKILLTDGGVYDNLGVEPVWDLCHTLVISDAGHPFSSAARVWQALVPRLIRAADISAEQVGAVRKRWLIERIKQGEWLTKVEAALRGQPRIRGIPVARSGTMWGINTLPDSFPSLPTYHYGLEAIDRLAQIRTDLNGFSGGERACLQNHGYWLAEAGIRQYTPGLAKKLGASFQWPVPDFAPARGTAEAALAGSAKRRILRDLACWIIGRTYKP